MIKLRDKKILTEALPFAFRFNIIPHFSFIFYLLKFINKGVPFQSSIVIIKMGGSCGSNRNRNIVIYPEKLSTPTAQTEQDQPTPKWKLV